jgi:uncharacterized protein (DUF58 family)
MNKSLLFTSGMSVGAGLMYLLDPDGGQHRRQQVQAQLQNYRHASENFLDQSRRRLDDQAHHMWRNVRPSFSSLFYSPREAWRSRFEPEPSRGVSPILWLGGVAIGLGLLYFLDPTHGQERRDSIRDKAQKYWKKQQKVLHRTAENKGNRTREMPAGARNRLSQRPSATETEEVEV